jgi:hypothetical protein
MSNPGNRRHAGGIASAMAKYNPTLDAEAKSAYQKGYDVRVKITQASVSPQRKYDEAQNHFPDSCEMRYHFSLGWAKADNSSGR